MAYIGQSRPVSGLGVPIKVLNPLWVISSSLGSGVTTRLHSAF